jgi:hypothetical protein
LLAYVFCLGPTLAETGVSVFGATGSGKICGPAKHMAYGSRIGWQIQGTNAKSTQQKMKFWSNRKI